MNSAPAGALCEMRQRVRAHPYAVDVLLALGVFAATLLGASTQPRGPVGRPHIGERGLDGQTVVLAALACAVLVLRRRTPMPVLCATCALTVAGLVLHAGVSRSAEGTDGGRGPLVLAAIIALYTVSNRTDRITSWRVGAVTVGVLTAASMIFGVRPWYAQENFAVFAWTALAAAAGEAVRSRRAFIDAIRERAERAERTREEEARRRVAEERMRIARELHDVVAHHIALVNVQAGVASHVMDRRPDQAKQALGHVREASRHALNELQTTVGLLRQSGESTAPTEPAPGLCVLDELVGGFTSAGLAVSVTAPAPDEEPALPAALDLTAYRVVQEALTNVQKHVGTGARAEVRIARGRGALEITVTDDGVGARGASPGRTAGPEGREEPAARTPETGEEASEPGGPGLRGSGGHGLIGMRERAAALHGECETGPLPGGGFRVRVRLPLPPLTATGAPSGSRTPPETRAPSGSRAGSGPGPGTEQGTGQARQAPAQGTGQGPGPGAGAGCGPGAASAHRPGRGTRT